MEQTTNYGFNVPIGSDLVNPLVQDFPNWTNLDTLLRNIANTGIGTANEVKTGTVHALTRADDLIPVFRFQATSNFETNDTFTVDGQQVSALSVDGQTLRNGAYVIGSMVLCELRDNLLTVYISGSTDAATLEGHSASYFATVSDLQTVDDKTDANKVLIDQIEDDLSGKNITFTNTSTRTPQYVNCQRVGNMCNISIYFPAGTPSATIGRLNVTAKGRQYGVSYIARGNDIAVRSVFIENNDNEIQFSDPPYVMLENYDFVLTLTFVCND